MVLGAGYNGIYRVPVLVEQYHICRVLMKLHLLTQRLLACGSRQTACAKLDSKSKRGRAEKVPVGRQGRGLRAPIKSAISSLFCDNISNYRQLTYQSLKLGIRGFLETFNFFFNLKHIN